MRPLLFALIGWAALPGCLTSPERIPLQPLPEDEPALEYREIVLRARLHAMAANEAFYVNKWDDIATAAHHLDQTAQLLLKAREVPAGRQEKLAANAAELSKDAGQLRAAAQTQDVPRTNELLQRIHLRIRDLRTEN